MKTLYIIIHSWSIKDVERQVNEAMIGGHFIPTGGIEFDGKEFYQAMVINQIPTCCC